MGISSTIPRQRIGRGLHDISPHPHFTVGRLSESILEFQVLNGSICPLPNTDSHVYGSCDQCILYNGYRLRVLGYCRTHSGCGLLGRGPVTEGMQ